MVVLWKQVSRRSAAKRFVSGVLLMLAAADGLDAEDLAFASCSFEADRYVVCRIAPPAVEAWLKSKPDVHPGAAFASFVKQYFETRGCDYKVADEPFRLNGVFFSLDSRAFAAISCNGSPLKLRFTPAAMSVSGMTFGMDADE